MSFTIDAETSGPWFDHDPARELGTLAEAVSLDVADAAQAAVQSRLGRVLHHPSGYYESRVIVDRAGDGAVVSDSGVAYGPWLEGISRRNQRSRFRGYHTFRLAAQDVEADVETIAQPAVERVVEALT